MVASDRAMGAARPNTRSGSTVRVRTGIVACLGRCIDPGHHVDELVLDPRKIGEASTHRALYAGDRSLPHGISLRSGTLLPLHHLVECIREERADTRGAGDRVARWRDGCPGPRQVPSLDRTRAVRASTGIGDGLDLATRRCRPSEVDGRRVHNRHQSQYGRSGHAPGALCWS